MNGRLSSPKTPGSLAESLAALREDHEYLTRGDVFAPGVTAFLLLAMAAAGIYGVMAFAVSQRTQEIGIRKAIGAKRRAVLTQFLFESSVICLFGGIIGIVLATLLTFVIDAVLMPASLSPGILLTAVIISILVGVLAGIVPAWRGARLDPIEALRYE